MMRRRPVLRTVGRTAVIAGTATAVSGRMMRHQNAVAQQNAAPAPEPESGAPVPGSPEAIAQLKELAALKEQGILTEDEFTAQKARLLA